MSQDLLEENAKLRQRVAELTAEVRRARTTATLAIRTRDEAAANMSRSPPRVLDKNAKDAFNRPFRP